MNASLISYSAPRCVPVTLNMEAMICQSPDVQNVQFGNNPGEITIPGSGVNIIGDF